MANGGFVNNNIKTLLGAVFEEVSEKICLKLFLYFFIVFYVKIVLKNKKNIYYFSAFLIKKHFYN